MANVRHSFMTPPLHRLKYPVALKRTTLEAQPQFPRPKLLCCTSSTNANFYAMADEAALLEGVFDDDTTALLQLLDLVPLDTKARGKGETLGVDGPEPVLALLVVKMRFQSLMRSTQLPILLLKRARGSVHKKLTARFIRRTRGDKMPKNSPKSRTGRA